MILVALVSHRSVFPETVGCLLHLQRDFDTRAFILSGALTIPARNKAVKIFKANCTPEDQLLFVDDDMTFTPSHLEMLLGALKETPSRGAVGCYAVMRDGTRRACFNWRGAKWQKAEWLTDEEKKARIDEHLQAHREVIPVDSTGTGFLLISGEALFKVREDPFTPRQEEIGEDTAFCLELKRKGFVPSVHLGCRVGHIGHIVFTAEADKTTA